jgi:hypothetical protein
MWLRFEAWGSILLFFLKTRPNLDDFGTAKAPGAQRFPSRKTQRKSLRFLCLFAPLRFQSHCVQR